MAIDHPDPSTPAPSMCVEARSVDAPRLEKTTDAVQSRSVDDGVSAVHLIERAAILVRRRRHLQADGGTGPVAPPDLSPFERPQPIEASPRRSVRESLQRWWQHGSTTSDGTGSPGSGTPDAKAPPGSGAGRRAAEEKRAAEHGCPDPPASPAVGDLVGLALSGGGIRSASFNLGVLQGLHARGALWMFDYLSTVSGGGFVGSWWSAWLSRDERRRGDLFPGDEGLEPGRRSETAVLHGMRAVNAAPDDERGRQNDPIHFLRLFSNYLTPRTGALSPDTWRMIAFYSRGLLLTWVVLVPVLLSAIVAGQAYFSSDVVDKHVAWAFLCDEPLEERMAHTQCRAADVQTIADATWIKAVHLLKAVGLFAAAWATLVVLWLIYASSPPWLALVSYVTVFAVGLVCLSGWSTGPSDGVYAAALAGSVLLVLLHHGWPALVRRLRPPGARAARDTQATPADYRAALGARQARVLRLGVAVTVLLFIAGFGDDIVDWLVRSAREWSGRAGWAAVATWIVSAGYTIAKALPSSEESTGPGSGLPGRILMAAAPPLTLFFLGAGLAWLSRQLLYFSGSVAQTGTLVYAVLGMAALQLLFGIVESYRDPQQPLPVSTFWERLTPDYFAHPKRSHRLVDVFSPRGWVRLWVAIAILIALIGIGGDLPGWGLGLAAPWTWPPFVVAGATLVAVLAVLVTLARRTWRLALGSARPAVLLSMAAVTSMTALVCAYRAAAAEAVNGPMSTTVLAPLWVVLLIGFVVCSGWLVDPNLLSMHGFYKARLARAYLGASNTSRDIEEVTDAAAGDDVAMKDVWNHDRGGPYHVVNTTLSLVGGSDLATSQRSAENFVMTKYHCGSARAGYRCTADYMSGQLSLATAAAISGAAVSPNMGSKTPSAALALFLSLFNLRLGFWAPNPSGRRWREPHARLWPFYVLKESLSNTGRLGAYCYLTDGGHFDNTGLYALVERGCRFIVVCDCGADPRLAFEDIGMAIRRCRIDFGAEIDLAIDTFTAAEPADRAHVVWGRIRYNVKHLQLLDLDPASPDGVIAWVKPAVTSRNAIDVQQYRRGNADFPQQSTADQWYDEAQFESYRRLGFESGVELATEKGTVALPNAGDFAAIPGWFAATE